MVSGDGGFEVLEFNHLGFHLVQSLLEALGSISKQFRWSVGISVSRRFRWSVGVRWSIGVLGGSDALANHMEMSHGCCF